MKRKFAREIMLTLLIIGMFTLAFRIEPVSAAEYPSINVDPEYPYPWDEVNVTVTFTTLMISIVDFGEVIQDGNTFYVFISVVGTGYYYVETHTHTYHLGNLPVGSYEFIVYSNYDELDGSTTLFIVSMHEWITVTSYAVEMSIENKTTPLGEELSILMMTPAGVFWLPDAQVFDVYLCDSNYSLFSYWSQNKLFYQMITSVPPGYNATLKWNLYHYDPSTGEFTPPPPGDYCLVGTIMGWEDVTPPIPIRIDESTVQILRSHTRRHCVRIRRHV